jgi:hypothetical protein
LALSVDKFTTTGRPSNTQDWLNKLFKNQLATDLAQPEKSAFLSATMGDQDPMLTPKR